MLDNGDRYTGQYLDNEFEGYGKYTYASGEIQYRGYFHKNKPHGAGSLLKLSKDSSVLPFEIYNGDWENGQKHGAGKYNYMRDVFYDGNWSRNQKEGTGILKTEEGEFVGEWKNDKKNGKGELVLKNGNKFAGRWVDDELVEGEVTYSNGDKYKGTLKNMKRHGRGKYTFVNNSVYEGEWIDNCKSGKGKPCYIQAR